MARREFPKAVKLAAWDRCGERCEDCGVTIKAGNGPEYDHDIPDAMGGEPVLSNCVVRCKTCHRLKTDKVDAPRIAKTKRQRAKHIGAARKSRPMPGSRASGWRKRMDGTIERRESYDH